MPIFRKLVREVSKAVFAIRANNQADADKVFDNFMNRDDDEKYDEYRDFMNAQCTEDISDLMRFENEEDYNRFAPVAADFWLESPNLKKKVPDPVYDLYLVDYNINEPHVWLGITIDKVADIIKEKNEKYILHSDPYINVECYKQAAMNNSTVIAYRMEKREE